MAGGEISGAMADCAPQALLHPTAGRIGRLWADRFNDPGLPGEMHTRVTLRAVACGTDLTIVQDGIPDVIPTEMCYLGWQESLLQLAQLVEPEIPD